MDAVYVVGAGGIGCALGHALRVARVECTFVEANRAKVEAGLRHGVTVAGRPPQPAPFLAFDDWHPEPGCLVLLCTKTYDNPAVLARLPASAMLLPVQNGFDPALEATDHGPEGIASFVSECDPDRPHTRITRRGGLHLGFRRPPTDTERAALAEVAGWLRHGVGFRVRMVDDIRPYKHAKLMYNAAISPLAAAAGLDNGDLLSLAPARRLFFALLRENHAILQAAGVPLATIGPFHPATVAKILRVGPLARLMAVFFRPSLRGTYCSMSGDLPRGRTEIDAYNRHLITLAGDLPCPLNRRVLELIHRMQEERRPPDPAVLAELETAGP